MATKQGAAVLLAVLFLAAASQAAAAGINGRDVLVKLVREVEARGGYSIMLSLLGKSGLVLPFEEYISAGQGATVLLPSNYAFSLLPPATLRLLLTDRTKLAETLAYHTLREYQTFAQLKGRKAGFKYGTIANQPLMKFPRTVTFGPPGATHDSQVATILHPNMAVSGHLIAHGINHVLIPPILPAL